MFDGMSSVKEYWKRANSNAHSNLETTSSDCSFDDSNSSTSKEYRDASCNVDFDCESDNLVDENVHEPANEVTTNIDDLIISRTDKTHDVKASRYIRWRVLMCLGIGLWAVLCIVDSLHSEKSLSRDWLYEFIWGKKIVPKVEVPQKLETPVFWYFNSGHYIWKMMTIMTSGGAYVLLFLLMVVFCADPRFKNPSHQTSTNNNESSKDSHSVLNNLIVEKKSVSNKSSLQHFDDPRVSKILSVRLELGPSINLQRNFLSSIEKCVQADLIRRDNSPMIRAVCSKGSRAMRVFDGSVNRCDESSTRFSINRQLVELLDAKNSGGKLQFSSINDIDWSSIEKIEAVLKDSVSLCVLEARKSDLNFNASTFDLEIGEYLKKTNPPMQKVSAGNSRKRNHESRRKSLNFGAGSSGCDKTVKTRIITSSPAFKKFLSNFQQNNDVP